MSIFVKVLLFIYIGLVVLLKVIELVSNISYRYYKSRARKGKKAGKSKAKKSDNFFLVLLGSLFSCPNNDYAVQNYVTQEQNRIFTENSIRAHEQAMADHMSAAQWHNDTFNNLF